MSAPRRWLLECAWVDGGVRDDVLVEVDGGRFTRVEPAAGSGPAGAEHLPGLTVPGLANCHSHAFHRALRGRTQRDRGSFWTWREQMYAVASRLDPDSYRSLAAAVFGEMALAGVTSVGEFHYVHHQPDGTAYDDANAMGLALVEAARDAGVRIALLDTCYLAAAIGRRPEGVQVRFSDGDADSWAARVDGLRSLDGAGVRVGAAVHSVRAVPRDQVGVVVAQADGRPLHVHVSEQPAENEQCLAAYGRTPVALLHEEGFWGPGSTAVHATHLTPSDVATLGGERARVCFCPTTERDLADGVGPARALLDAGAPLTLGSDSHAVVDLFEEMRAVETDERLVSGERGHWAAGELLDAATHVGHASLGFDDAGRIAVGARADLVTLDVASTRTAGTGAGTETAVFAATTADVVGVVADGRVLLEVGERPDAERELGRRLAETVEQLWEGA